MMPKDKKFSRARVTARFYYGTFKGDRNCNICILGVSPSNSSFQGESFFALLLAIKAEKQFSQVKIVVTDTLNRIGYERDGDEPSAAYLKSKALGQYWRYDQMFQLGEDGPTYSHQQMIDSVFPKECGVEVVIESWDEQRCKSEATKTDSPLSEQALTRLSSTFELPSSEPTPTESEFTSTLSSSSSGPAVATEPALTQVFVDIHKRVTTIYDENKTKNSFAERVQKAAMKLATDSENDSARSIYELVPYNVRYILELLTGQTIWAIKYKHSVAPHPRTAGAGVMMLIQEAFTMLLDIFELDKNSLYLEHFMMNSKVKLSTLSKRPPNDNGSASFSAKIMPLPIDRPDNNREDGTKSSSVCSSKQRLLPPVVQQRHMSTPACSSSSAGLADSSSSTLPPTSSPTKTTMPDYSPSTAGKAGFFSPGPTPDIAEMVARLDGMLPYFLRMDPEKAALWLYTTLTVRTKLVVTTTKQAQFLVNHNDDLSLSLNLSSPLSDAAEMLAKLDAMCPLYFYEMSQTTDPLITGQWLDAMVTVRTQLAACIKTQQQTISNNEVGASVSPPRMLPGSM